MDSETADREKRFFGVAFAENEPYVRYAEEDAPGFCQAAAGTKKSGEVAKRSGEDRV